MSQIVRIIELRCLQKHRMIVAPYLSESGAPDLPRMVTLRNSVAAMIERKMFSPVCGRCGSDLHYEDVPTVYTTMEQAAEALLEEQQQAEFLYRSRN